MPAQIKKDFYCLIFVGMLLYSYVTMYVVKEIDVNILCAGMMCCDVTLKPVPKNLFSLDHCHIIPPVTATGGDALNVAIDLAKLGCQVAIAGRIGNDTNGHFILDTLKKHKINQDSVITDDEYPTAVSYVLVDEQNERHFISSNQINERFSFNDICKEQIEKADIVYFGSFMQMRCMDHRGIKDLFQKAKSMGKITILDAAISYEEQDWKGLADSILPFTDYFLPSWEEARMISQKNDLKDITDFFLRYNQKTLAVKLGKKGCFISDRNQKYIVGSLSDFPVVDTDGAGDSFVAAFICSLAHGYSLLDQAKFSNYVASLCVGSVGTSTGVPYFKDASEKFNKYLYTVESVI